MIEVASDRERWQCILEAAIVLNGQRLKNVHQCVREKTDKYLYNVDILVETCINIKKLSFKQLKLYDTSSDREIARTENTRSFVHIVNGALYDDVLSLFIAWTLKV